jgi:UDP-2,3-diacylglucosamine pyrophosphatase LpxH
VISVGYYAVVKRLIIADAHVDTRAGDAGGMADLVRRLADNGFEEVIYLGDAFQYLIGMSKFWTRGVHEVMAAWREARGQGIRIVLVEGNRDFFLDEPELANLVDWTGRCYEFESGTMRFRLDHGDRINLRDLQYQFWSRVSKSRVARVWARLLPRTVAVGIVRRMEARLAATNVRFRYKTPVAALRKAAAKAWKDGVHVLFWGHFHREWHCSDGDRLAMVVPAWLESNCCLGVNPDGEWSLMDGDLAPATLPTDPQRE